MRDTLENLYFGNITPMSKTSPRLSPGRRYGARRNSARRSSLPGWRERENPAPAAPQRGERNLQSMALENYILGFRLGMRIAIEALTRTTET